MRISDWSSDVCSSDLWFKKPSANAAAIKAFVVNRVGDLGFMLGIFGTYLVFQTVSIPEILQAAPDMAGSTIGFLGMRWDTMTILCLLLFVGAMGKSAQIGLHTWLPDAMEGPTPVSARSEEHTSELQSLMRISYAV